jgi:hypothetical protein
LATNPSSGLQPSGYDSTLVRSTRRRIPAGCGRLGQPSRPSRPSLHPRLRGLSRAVSTQACPTRTSLVTMPSDPRAPRRPRKQPPWWPSWAIAMPPHDAQTSQHPLGRRHMHVYRDAIIDTNGSRLVKAAAVLAPRPSGLPEATTQLPLDRPGVLTVRPGHGQLQFQHLLDISLHALGISSSS